MWKADPLPVQSAGVRRARSGRHTCTCIFNEELCVSLAGISRVIFSKSSFSLSCCYRDTKKADDINRSLTSSTREGTSLMTTACFTFVQSALQAAAKTRQPAATLWFR